MVDENGTLLDGMDAGLGFSKPKSEGCGSETSGVRGLTNESGLYTNSGDSEQILYYGARHSDYYISRSEFTKFTGISEIIGFRK